MKFYSLVIFSTLALCAFGYRVTPHSMNGDGKLRPEQIEAKENDRKVDKKIGFNSTSLPSLPPTAMIRILKGFFGFVKVYSATNI